MSVSSLGSVDPSSLQLVELARPEPGSVVSLEGRLIERFASAAVGTERDHAESMPCSSDRILPTRKS